MLKCQQPAGKKIDYFIAVTPGFTDSSLYHHWACRDQVFLQGFPFAKLSFNFNYNSKKFSALLLSIK